MSSIVVVLAALSTLATGLVAGVHLAGSGALNRALRSLSPRDYLVVKRACDTAFPPLMKPLLQTALALAAVTTAAAAVAGQLGSALSSGTALAASVVVLLAVLRGDLPINQRMAAWDEAAPPQGWHDVRAAWERWFAVRSTASCAAFAAALVAALTATM